MAYQIRVYYTKGGVAPISTDPGNVFGPVPDEKEAIELLKAIMTRENVVSAIIEELP